MTRKEGAEGGDDLEGEKDDEMNDGVVDDGDGCGDGPQELWSSGCGVLSLYTRGRMKISIGARLLHVASLSMRHSRYTEGPEIVQKTIPLYHMLFLGFSCLNYECLA